MVERLGLTERLNVAIKLGEDGQYVAVPSDVDGKVEALLVLGSTDRDRWLRHGPRGAAGDSQFTAGRIVLTGRASITAADPGMGPVIPLDGNTADFPVFRESDAPSVSRWPFERTYQLLNQPELSSGPIWITPSVLPGSNRRSLELELQWVKLGPDKQPLDIEMVEFFELTYSDDWGEVEQVSRGNATTGSAEADGRGRPRRKVRWTQILPTAAEREDRRLTLGVRFKKEVVLKGQVSGSVEVVMKGALSGVENIELFGSLGEPRQQSSDARIRTRITARYDLSLAKIRYQAERVFPRHHLADSESGQLATSFDVVPNAETVIELTDAMSERGYYVKRVIENPPRSGNKADVVQRYWDIAGRHYYGLWPLDFHLILTGEEFHRGDIRPADGNTKVRIIVRASYSNSAMEEQIAEFWKDLDGLTRETIQSLTPTDRASSMNGSAPAGGGPRLFRDRPGLVRAETTDSFLQEYRRKLIESWINGRITDEEFWEMCRRAEEDCRLPPDLGPEPDDEPDSDDEDDGSG